ncbi:MAG: hypothetical protein CMN30_15690 [Sandaracinus sp.]|nr:hypothetical protein [Sandaracinus sp.]
MGEAGSKRVWLLVDEPSSPWQRLANVMSISRTEVFTFAQHDSGSDPVFDPDVVVMRVGDRNARGLAALRRLRSMPPIIGVFRSQLQLRYTSLLNLDLAHVHDEDELASLPPLALALAGLGPRLRSDRTCVALLDPDAARRNERARALAGAGFQVVCAEDATQLENTFIAHGGVAATIRSDSEPVALSLAAGVVMAARPVAFPDLAGERTLGSGWHADRLPDAVSDALKSVAEERRDSGRVTTAHPIRFRTSARAPWTYAVTQDVSRNGLQLRTGANVPTGTLVQLEMETFSLRAQLLARVQRRLGPAHVTTGLGLHLHPTPSTLTSVLAYARWVADLSAANETPTRPLRKLAG